MIEGWYNDDYLCICEGLDEAACLTELYAVPTYLPGYTVLGLRGWDDFIVGDAEGRLFTVPTVPMRSEYLEPFEFPADLTQLKPDSRLAGKVKWYKQPLVFGGDPRAEENVAWITIEVHAQVVQTWNKIYREIAPNVTREDP